MDRTAQDRLEAAVAALASGPGALKDRIARAWEAHLEALDPAQLPLASRDGFTRLSAQLHSARALPGDTVVRASARKLGAAEAAIAAGFLVHALREACCAPAREAAALQQDVESFEKITELRLASTG